MYRLLEYIKYCGKAKLRHGVHSPYVYNYTDHCLRIKISEEDQKKIALLFDHLKNDNRIITIEDHGAGSKKLGSKRRISGIFKTSSSRGKYGALLYKTAHHYAPKRILELGTSLGVGTLHLHLGFRESEITTLEGCTETFKVAKALLPEGIKAVNTRFEPFIAQDHTVYDLIFVDGHHDGEALLSYMKLLQKNAHEDTIFILDDIRWSNSMLSAWNQLVHSEKYHVTLDLFRLGIVVQRPQQEKEHFVTRY